MMNLPAKIESVSQIEDVMTAPSPELIESMKRMKGDLLILGVAGKMGPTMAVLAKRALTEAGNSARVIGVARFSRGDLRERLESAGIETVTADLLAPGVLDSLPDAPNVLYLVGQKFGSTGNESQTWAMNVYLPGLVADRYRNSRIVSLSTGNVYAFTPSDSRGPDEDAPVGPVGEYAQSCLGRERMFQYFSGQHGSPGVIVRLNYAIDLRYGVLLDIATKVHSGAPVDLTMGHVNVIWQGDANEAVLRSLEHAASPPMILNLTGPNVLSVRELALGFGCRLGRDPVLVGVEAPNALLSNADKYVRLMGSPRVSIECMMDWIAHWVRIGGQTLNKPTHFETRDGKF
jgi:nucleoside-diphosphate-sugar epimerase